MITIIALIILLSIIIIASIYMRSTSILNSQQHRALHILREYSKRESDSAASKFHDAIRSALALSISVPTIKSTIPSLTVDDADYVHDEISKYIATRAPITINIDPNIIGILLKDRIYRSTFEVKTSKSAQYLAQRTAWESACFLGLYDNATNFDRPKYAALNYLNCPQGIPDTRRYGQWYFTLKDSLRKRCTITPGDSEEGGLIGVLDFCDHILVNLYPDELRALADVATGRIEHAPPTSYIHYYREVQIHGELNCNRDVASLHIPAVHFDTPAYSVAMAFSRKYKVPIIIFDE